MFKEIKDRIIKIRNECLYKMTRQKKNKIEFLNKSIGIRLGKAEKIVEWKTALENLPRMNQGEEKK